MKLAQLRKEYHRRICKDLLRIRKDSKKGEYPNNADGDSKISVKIASGIVGYLCENPIYGAISGQKAGMLFQEATKGFLEKAFELLQHLRPGKWSYSINTAISNFDQYKDLAEIAEVIRRNRELATTLGSDYIVSPDIVIGREPELETDINKREEVLSKRDLVAKVNPSSPLKYRFAEVNPSCQYFV